MTDLRVPAISAAELMDGSFLVVDVRSPTEFADGHVPGAVNMPLLTDAQRDIVGTTYRHQGAAEARMRAVEEVAAGLPRYLRALAELVATLPKGCRPAVMCWRGGERSRNVVLLLALTGVHAVAVVGGYRAYRRQVLSGLGDWVPSVPVVSLHGHTGVGKSALLRGLAQVASGVHGKKPWPVDLEELALHRGSVLGGLNQPGTRGQKDFDALLWEELRRPKGDYLVIEGEGGRIGPVYLPLSVAKAIRNGLPVLLVAPVERRVERIMREYRPERWTAEDRDGIRSGLRTIGLRVSRETSAFLESALDDGRFTDVVRRLLIDYYDPLYRRSSVEGRRFIMEFETGADPAEDARRFVRDMARAIEEVSLREPPS